MEEHLIKILKNIGGDTADDIERIEKGYNSRVYASENYVIKIIKNPMSAEKEVRVIDFLSEKLPEFPVPRVVRWDDSESLVPFKYTVLTRLPGETLDDAYDTINEKPSVFFSLGRFKGMLNSIRNNVFGDIDKKLHITNRFESWSEFMENDVTHSLGKLKEQGFDITDEEKFWSSAKHILKHEIGPCLCHGDTSLSNILVMDSQIMGFIDFEYARWGGGMHDLFSSIRGFKTLYQHTEDILRGYAEYYKVGEWERLMWLYQWIANIKQLSNIRKMKWRELTEEECERRKRHIYQKSMQKVKMIKEKVL